MQRASDVEFRLFFVWLIGVEAVCATPILDQV
jgi:hypothetical protein